MKVLCDEGIEYPIVEHLRNAGHDVSYVGELQPGMDDDTVIRLAADQSALLVTSDKDFGELIFRQRRAAPGVILLRLAGMSNEAKSALVVTTLRDHANEIAGAFTVISPGRVRIRRGPTPP